MIRRYHVNELWFERFQGGRLLSGIDLKPGMLVWLFGSNKIHLVVANHDFHVVVLSGD